jgi:transposase
LYSRCALAGTNAEGVYLACRQGNAIRFQVESKGAMPNIPPKVNRRWKNCFSPFLYRNRNAIERMFGRLKDFRRIATRYDRLAQNFLAAICLAATISYWF